MGVDTTGLKELDEKMYEAEMKGVQNLPAGYRDEMMYIFNFLVELNYEDRSLGSMPQIPIVVFAGTNHPERITSAESENPIEKAINSVEYYKALERQRIESYTKWIFESPKGYLIVSPKAGHYFHLDEPQLVIEMIKRLLEAE